MEQEDFKPKLTDPSLVFTSEDFVILEDLKRGLRKFLCRFYPPNVVLGMVQSLNFNYLSSRTRSARVIVITADGSPLAECIIVDIYARLTQHKSTIRTTRANYYGILEGVVDHQRMNLLTMHYFWLSAAFQTGADTEGQRFHLN